MLRKTDTRRARSTFKIPGNEQSYSPIYVSITSTTDQIKYNTWCLGRHSTTQRAASMPPTAVKQQPFTFIVSSLYVEYMHDYCSGYISLATLTTDGAWRSPPPSPPTWAKPHHPTKHSLHQHDYNMQSTFFLRFSVIAIGWIACSH